MQTFVGKAMSLLFNMLSKFAIAFLPRRNSLLILWLQPLTTVILEPKKRKSVTASTFSCSICHEVIGSDAMILVFWMLSFKPTFFLSSLIFIKLVSFNFLPLGWYHLHIWGCWYFSQESWFQLVIHSTLIIPCPVLTVASWPTYRFFRSQVRWLFVLSCCVSLFTLSISWDLLFSSKSVINFFNPEIIFHPEFFGSWSLQNSKNPYQAK